MLLHEVGHLVKKTDGAWLLPDDGNDAEQSNRNTLTIQDRCLGQITGLRKLDGSTQGKQSLPRLTD